MEWPDQRPWLNQLQDLKSKHLKGRFEIFCKRKNTLEDDLIQAHMHFLGAAGKGCEDSGYLKIFELVDISPSQQLLHTGKVSIEHWNMAPMDWVGILGQKYWINLQTKDLKYFKTDIFVRSNGTSTERLLVAFTLYTIRAMPKYIRFSPFQRFWSIIKTEIWPRYSSS